MGLRPGRIYPLRKGDLGSTLSVYRRLSVGLGARVTFGSPPNGTIGERPRGARCHLPDSVRSPFGNLGCQETDGDTRSAILPVKRERRRSLEKGFGIALGKSVMKSSARIAFVRAVLVG